MRFLLMLAVTGAICFGILKFKERLDHMYGRYITDDALVKGSSGGLAAAAAGSTATYLRSSRPEIVGEMMTSLAIDPACRQYASDIQKLDLIALDRDHYKVSYQQLPVKPENCAFNDPAILSVMETMRTKCKPTINASETISDACASALFMARAATTKQVYGQKPLSQITDLRVLTDLMFAEFALINNQTLPNLNRAKAVADRMLDLNPKMYVAAKVIAFAEVIEGLSSKEWTAASNAVARAKELNPSDESLKDAEMLIATRGFEPHRALEYGDNLITADPSNPNAWYLKAYAEWKLGNRQNALMNLKKAATLAPDNKVYSQTYIEASRPNARADAFKGSITFGVDSGDFDK